MVTSFAMCWQEELELSRGESHYNVSTQIIPPLGGGIFNCRRRSELRPLIISPHDRRYRIWETFLVTLAVYTAWVSPFEFGFLKKPQSPLSIMDNVVNGFFAVDIVLTFFVAYISKATYLFVDDPKQIAWNYARTWLAFDVMSIIPLELVGKISPAPNLTYVLLNILRLLRLRRVSALFSQLEKDINYNFCWVRCTKLICVTLFAIHCAGCFYFLLVASYYYPKRKWVGETTENLLQQSLWTRYVTSIYWSIGYGDLHPINEREIIFHIFYMLFNMGLITYLIASVISLVVHDTSQTRKFRDTIQAASRFAHRNYLPLRLEDQMLAHLSLKFRTDSEALQQEALESLPKAIRLSISHYLFYSLMDKVYLFCGISKELHFQLVSEMKPQYFPPKEDVILQNEAPTDFYILVTGAVELLFCRNGVEQVVGEARTGDLCGEIGVLCCKPQLFTVRTKQLSQLLRLSRTTLFDIVQTNVGDGTIIMNNFLQHLKELNDPIMKGVLGETKNMLARGRMNLPVSLCFAAVRGYDLLFHQLLKQGLDPNESDNTGKTALHVAASRAEENLVLLLLDYGADSNIRDLHGNVPLWEAILGGHESVTKLLVENGATLQCGDVGQYACTAVELNSLNLLRDIMRHGGDITLPNNKNGNTALHVAVTEGNAELVKFLLDHGANIDTSNKFGWTPRALADQLGHSEIKVIFESRGT